MKLFSFARTERHFITEWWWTVDRALIVLILILMAIGTALVMTASPPVAERIGVSSLHFIIRHVLILAPCLMLLIGLSFLTERSIWRVATFILLGGILTMIAVLLMGEEEAFALLRQAPFVDIHLQTDDTQRAAVGTALHDVGA